MPNLIEERADRPAISMTVASLMTADPEWNGLGNLDVRVTGLAYHSRLVRTGDLFAALPGDDFDGHDFAAGAVERGAVALLVERPLPFEVPQIMTSDSRASLAKVAAALFGDPSREVAVIGVTGTDGKTTTTYLVDAILRAADYRTGLIGTVSVRIGDWTDDHATRQTTPESVDVQRYLRRMVDHDVDWAILEATSHGLDCHRLDGVRFRIGAVTNVTHEHLEHHKTLAAYRRAKGRLFERVAQDDGIAIVNADDQGAREMVAYAGGAEVVRYSMTGADADVRAEDVRLRADASLFRLATSAGSVEVELPLIGAFNVANALCAASIALAAGVPLTTIANGLSSAPAVPGRVARVAVGQPFSVVVDYAHTPESLAKVLELLRTLHREGRLVAVFGSAGERDVAKRALQGEVATRLADFSVFTTEDPRFEDADAIIAQIAAGAEQAGGQRGRTFVTATDRRDAIRLACEWAQPGDCVLLAGKGHEQSIIWEREKRPWDEATVAREVLAELGYRDDR